MGIASFSAKAKQYITIPLSLEGVGLSSAKRSRDSAHWSSWAKSFPMIRNGHPVVATTMILGLNARAIPTFHAVGKCSDTLQNVGFTPPSWEYFAKGEPPPPPEENVESEDDRNIPRGWQKASTKMVEQAYFSAKIQPQLTEPEAALWRLQQGLLASVPFIVFPTNRATRIDPQPFRVLLCRRLHLPLPFSSRRSAVYLTPMAIIVQRAGKLGCWEDEDFQWRKPQHRFAGKVAAECQPTLRSETWTSHQLELAIQGGWKLL